MSPPTALVIDDSPSSRLVIAAVLRNLGLAVLTAEDGATGLALAREQRPAIICLDLVLPTLSGFEVCERLRQDPITAAIPVIVVSARQRPEDRAAADRLGVRAFLTKPVDPEQFSAQLRSLLRDHGAADG